MERMENKQQPHTNLVLSCEEVTLLRSALVYAMVSARYGADTSPTGESREEYRCREAELYLLWNKVGVR